MIIKKVMVVLFSFLLLTAMSGCATTSNRDPWTFTDQALYTAAAGLHAADWLHTRAGIGKYGLQESNIILGEHPTMGQIDTYFAATAVGLTVAAWYSPTKWRRSVLIGWAVVELVSVMHNQTLGVSLSY